MGVTVRVSWRMTYLIFLGVSHQQKKNQEYYFLELDDILVDIELVSFRRSKVPICQPVPKNIFRKIKIPKSHSRWKKFQFWIFSEISFLSEFHWMSKNEGFFFEKVRCSASSWWSSSQYCHRRNLDQMTTGNPHPTLNRYRYSLTYRGDRFVPNFLKNKKKRENWYLAIVLH